MPYSVRPAHTKHTVNLLPIDKRALCNVVRELKRGMSGRRGAISKPASEPIPTRFGRIV